MKLKRITKRKISKLGAQMSVFIPRGSLILTIQGSIGRVAITDYEAYMDRTLLVFQKFHEKVDLKFIMYIIRELFNEAKENANGSTIKTITKEELSEYTINLPPLPQQQTIAKILTTVDNVIEKTENAIAKYQAIKQGLMHDLFTRGIDVHTGQLRPTPQEAPELYYESALGLIPLEWVVEELRELTIKIGSGSTPTGGSEVYQTAGILFIRSQNVLNGKLSIKDAAFISPEIDEKMSGSRVSHFDVLLNITGASIGRCAYFPTELSCANVNQHVCIIRLNEVFEENSIFTVAFLNSEFGQTQIKALNAGGNREGLNFQQIGSFNFPRLSNDEIIRISLALQTFYQKIQTEQESLAKYQQVKAGLLQDLLTGKVEVVV